MSQEIPARATLRALNSYTVDLNGCHISTYSTASHGYAQIGWQTDGKAYGTTAHRAAWVAATGSQIPDGMTIDHLCKVRPCVNPAHLRMLSNYENARRTFGRDWPLGQCINGHSNDEQFTEPSGRIRCRSCARAIWLRSNAKRPSRAKAA